MSINYIDPKLKELPAVTVTINYEHYDGDTTPVIQYNGIDVAYCCVGGGIVPLQFEIRDEADVSYNHSDEEAKAEKALLERCGVEFIEQESKYGSYTIYTIKTGE